MLQIVGPSKCIHCAAEFQEPDCMGKLQRHSKKMHGLGCPASDLTRVDPTISDLVDRLREIRERLDAIERTLYE